MTTKPSNAFRSIICVCTWRDIDIKTVTAINHTLRSQNPKFDVIYGTGDALIDRTRSVNATRFLQNKSMGEVLLFIDSDIVFEPRDAITLAKLCNQGYPVIGGFYVTRNEDLPRPAIRLKPSEWTNFDASGEPIEIIYASTGFMAIHRKVLEDLAKDLPLCNPGDNSELYPFFQPRAFDHGESEEVTGSGWEYLSEDWAFCELARQKGYKIHLAPTVQVGHQGLRTFWVNDLSQKTVDRTYAVVTEGKSYQSEMINELARFRGLDPRAVAETMDKQDPIAGLIGEWNKASPKTQEEVSRFWATADVAVEACAVHSISKLYRAKIDFTLNLIKNIDGPILDLGSQAGSFSIAAMKNEKYPIYIEPLGPLRDFAASRCATNRLNIQSLTDIDQARQPDGRPAIVAAVVAIDSLNLSHPDRSQDLVRQAYERLAPGGIMIVCSTFEDSPDFYLTSNDDIRAMLAAAGFSGGPEIWRKVN